MELKPTIGLEVHCELRTNSKLFCGCPADHFGKEPNTQTCPVCLGLPGALPVANKKAIEWTQLLGLAIGAKINKNSKFDRKHYFYPDLPMGYQISQYDEPFCTGGFLETSEGRVNITRVHLEIDTGKLQHAALQGENVSLIDFNRSGVPLMEIVTEPDIKSGLQAKEFAKNLQQIIRYLGISDCDMEKGSMRLEANVSLGLSLGYKVEVKNLNSFRFLDKAINYELKRQKKTLENGEKLRQETRGWSESKNITVPQRSKETAEDYRYFPDPDLPPMVFSVSQIAEIRSQLPELPSEKKNRLMSDYKLPENYASILATDKEKAEFYENALKVGVKENMEAKEVANLIVNKGLSADTPNDLIKKAKDLITKSFTGEEEIERAVKEVMAEQEKAVDDYKKGKTAVVGFLMGMTQKKLKGSGNPSEINKILLKKLT